MTMLPLSKQTIRLIKPQPALFIPNEKLFALPEKVLQFGTGVLLRGLPDYFIDKANRQGIFNGRIVVIKSTSVGAADVFEAQNGLYTLCVRGIEDGKTVEQNIIHSSISRVLAANSQWNEILQCAANPDLQLIISNTTEIGIVLDETDDINASPPKSFPGKLLSFLYKRYQVFKGDTNKGMVIIPTELIPGNADRLKTIVDEMANKHRLENTFINWLHKANFFCNSLVDRIIPGKMAATAQSKMEEQLGYTDILMIMSESYRLWAIETGNQKVKEILSFSKADEGVVIAPDIELFRELKLRLLNGSHTFSCGLAWLAGFRTVKEAMADTGFSSYISNLMMQEIAPAIASDDLAIEKVKTFATKVLDRFRNPHIEHAWISITLQYSSKMKTRNIPIIKNWLDRFNVVPEYICLGMAAHILFMKCQLAEDGKYYGEKDGLKYPVNDDNAGWYAEKWRTVASIPQLVADILGDKVFWGMNFADYPGFIKAISGKLQELIQNGAMVSIKQISPTAKPQQA